MLLATITNMSGRSLAGQKPVKPADFLGKTKPQSMQEQIEFMKSIGNPDG